MEPSMPYIHLQEKIGQALSGGLGAYALALVGYDSSVQVQTAEVAGGIYNVATLVPGILLYRCRTLSDFYLSTE